MVTTEGATDEYVTIQEDARRAEDIEGYVRGENLNPHRRSCRKLVSITVYHKPSPLTIATSMGLQKSSTIERLYFRFRDAGSWRVARKDMYEVHQSVMTDRASQTEFDSQERRSDPYFDRLERERQDSLKSRKNPQNV